MKHTLKLMRLHIEHNYGLSGRSREAFSLSACPLIASWLCRWSWRGTDVRPSSRGTKNADEFKGPSKPKTATTQASHDNHSSVSWGDAERLNLMEQSTRTGSGGQVALLPSLPPFSQSCWQQVSVLTCCTKVKVTVQTKLKNTCLVLTYNAIDPSKLFWCTFSSFIDVSDRDVCLLSNIMELDTTWLVVIEAPKN